MAVNLENSAVATGLGKKKKKQFSFQSQKMAMGKNDQTTIQLYSYHMLAKSCSKALNPALKNT